nr:uncharacterized protein LOC571061 isoform X5 [Danio rerio]|eukprot:XP_009302560.1 uncharacterized protein LOC571061 isoform X5 [Danio rerio]
MKYCDKSTSRLNNMPMSTTLLDEEQTILFASTFTSLTHEHGDRKTRETSVKLPLSRKLCYAVGAAPYQMTNIAIGFSLQIFLLDVVQMEAFSVSLILFISHVWDAVTDPLVGYLVSRSKWTQIGKLMPWAVLSTPLVILSYIFLWLIPFRATSSAVSVPWFLTISCLFETFMSCYSVPYITLSMFLGGDQQHRDSATAYRTSVEAFSMLMAAVIQGQVLWVFNKERDQACLNAEQTPDLPHTALHESRKAFMFSALVMSSLFFVCCMVLFLGVKEQKDVFRQLYTVLLACCWFRSSIPASHVGYTGGCYWISASVADDVGEAGQENHTFYSSASPHTGSGGPSFHIRQLSSLPAHVCCDWI